MFRTVDAFEGPDGKVYKTIAEAKTNGFNAEWSSFVISEQEKSLKWPNGYYNFSSPSLHLMSTPIYKEKYIELLRKYELV